MWKLKEVISDIITEGAELRNGNSVKGVSERDLIFDTPSGEMPIDDGIMPAVHIMWDNGFDTFESCEGGEGHAYFEPTIRFLGTEFDLIRAYEVWTANGLIVGEVKRVYRKCTSIYDKEGKRILGHGWEQPINEIIFYKNGETETIFRPNHA